jgi:hypothetical protein
VFRNGQKKTPPPKIEKSGTHLGVGQFTNIDENEFDKARPALELVRIGEGQELLQHNHRLLQKNFFHPLRQKKKLNYFCIRSVNSTHLVDILPIGVSEDGKHDFHADRGGSIDMSER